ncbi:hypothetical protein Anas_08774 [Armadillidium nasatum]|uniref:Uncharacterized protein n=1 Tax=Armadillidium nasatum TaxID=96803 RepID=A0A5N5SUD7_9CRUS|nr:hypothetical protein Anas_08774 [Armadillidium nasatum]
MKASSHGKISSQGTEPSVAVTTESSSVNNIVSQRESRLTKTRTRDRTSADENSIIGLRENISSGSILSYMPVGPSGYASQSLDRKGSGHKIKKSKSGKVEKTPMTKAESQKHRDKELLWLEKELHKIEREKQRLEREKEKFMEREARLEKMRHAMRQGPAEKKEIYIKTSTGEFRFEGISQTFTKKLYEWEERRGIRPESRSESSVVEMNQSSGTQATVSHQSSISLNDIDKEEDDNKASSEPTLSADEEVETPKCAVLVQMEEELVEESDSQVVKNETEGEVDPNYQDPYAPAEITRLIDSSGR